MAMAVESLVDSPLVVEKPIDLDINQIPAQVSSNRPLGVTVIRNGSCETVTEYFRDTHPYLGRSHQGLTGPETAIVRVSIRPVRTFMVVDDLNSLQIFGK